MRPTALAAGLLWLPLAGAAATLAADGAAVLDLQSDRLALAYVEAPPRGAVCDGPAGEWRCGRIARLALRHRVAQDGLRCATPDAGGAAVCTAGGEDLSVWLLEAGWARAAAGASALHHAAERAARSARRGIWRDGGGGWRLPVPSAADGLSCDACAARHRRVTDDAAAHE